MCSPIRVCCFVCFKTFSKTKRGIEKCKICGDFKCPYCGGCLCSLNVGEQRVALAMMKTYEPLIGGNYDFSSHKKIEKRVKESLARDKNE